MCLHVCLYMYILVPIPVIHIYTYTPLHPSLNFKQIRKFVAQKQGIIAVLFELKPKKKKTNIFNIFFEI